MAQVDDSALNIPDETARLLAALNLRLPKHAAEYYRKGWWRNETVIDDFRKACRAHGGKTAIVSYRYDSDSPHRLTYAELGRAVERTAGALLHLGVTRGDVVSIQLPNRWQFVVFALAIQRIGAILNPIIPIHREHEVTYITRLLQSKVYVSNRIYRDFDYSDMIREVRKQVPSIRHRIVCDGVADEDEISFEDRILKEPWEEKYRQALSGIVVDANSVSDIQFTSGTTGDPKGVGHTFNTLYARARTVFGVLHLTSDDTVFMPSTLAHSTGYVYGCVTPVSMGMTAVYQDRWDPERALEIIAAEGAVWSFGSTTFIVDLVRAFRKTRVAVPSFRYFISGGAKIPPAVVTETQRELGSRLLAVWGMTENGAVTITRLEEPEGAAGESDGMPCPWMEAKIVDPETLADVPVGTDGKLLVRGANQMLGYVLRPELTAGSFDADGWFDTGDLAQIDAEGHIRITGRTKDIIIRGGENIPVATLESALYEYPAIEEVAVIAVPDERLGERACAVVVPAKGAAISLDDLRAFLQQKGISRTYWPERLELLEQMPHTLSGKIQKFKLREQFAGG